MSGTPDPGLSDYFSPRECLREPIPEMYEAMWRLDKAAQGHLAGDRRAAHRALLSADIPAIRDWIESLRGRRDLYPEKVHHLRTRDVEGLPPGLPRESRIPARKPGPTIEAQVIARFGWHCAYCGIGLYHRRARQILRQNYPEALRWGSTNDEKHLAFMCMDNEFDHVVPHSRGGTNDLENLVPSCAPCNCGKENRTLEQPGLLDPRRRAPKGSIWDGLTRLLGGDVLSGVGE